MDKELEDVKQAVEEAIIKKNKEDFFIGYSRWLDKVYAPDFPFFEREVVFEEGWIRDVKLLDWYGTHEEFTEKLLEAAKLSDTYEYKIREAKKEIDKDIKRNDIRELATIYWNTRHVVEDIELSNAIMGYIDVKIDEGDILEEFDEEYARIERVEAEKEIKKDKKKDREKEEELYKYRPPTRREQMQEIQKLQLSQPVVIPSVGVCDYCHIRIEPGKPYYKDKGKVYHRSCAMKVFPERKWFY